MKKNKHPRLLVTIVAVLVLLSALSGCQTGRKFDSPESMISEMIGTYSGSDEHSGERIVIDGINVTKFNIDHMFPEITDDNFFWENFPNENWETFDINALLGKTYIDITTASISANIKDSTISGLWVKKDGVLFSSQKGYPLNKISSDSSYPTAEMLEKFEGYLQYLKEYEISAIIAESESNLSEKQNSLESALSSATSSNSASKSAASAETIAECAFESIKDYLKYPRTAELDGYSNSPQYDPYGRVTTLITVTAQNGFGNYITEDYYVVLQSCSSAGYYTHKTGGMHYTTEKNHFSFLLTLNDWNEDPNADSAKEPSYNEAIQLIKNKEYGLAANKLAALGDYKSSVKLKEACINLSVAEEYKKAIDLFAEGKYAEASKELTSLLKGNDDGYLRAERIITLCAAASSNTSSNGDDAGSGNNSDSGNISQPPATQPPTTESPATQPPATQPPVTQPPGTQPPATQPPATQPPATEPPATEPPATQPPAVCAHNFINATCTKPKTCTKCGATTGSALGHSWKDASCTAPKTCNSCGATSGSAAGHKWSNITQTVHHEEQGHYEDVQDAKKVQKYRCWLCSYAQPTYATKDAYYAHFDSVHGNESNSSFFRERYEMVEDWVYETVTVWVVDKEAYTETVVTGRKCDVCGEEE